MAETEGGVLISNGRCSVRLTRSGEPNELGYPTIIEVRAGPFQGSVLDSAVGYAGFREQLSALYESLLGEANIYSYEGNELVLTGNGTGGSEFVSRSLVSMCHLYSWPSHLASISHICQLSSTKWMLSFRRLIERPSKVAGFQFHWLRNLED